MKLKLLRGDALWRWLSWAGLALCIALWAMFGTDAGVSWDELARRSHGDLVLAWWRSGFRDDHTHTNGNMYLYGGLWDTCAQWVVGLSPLGVFETRHLLSGLTALLGIVATWKIGRRLGGPRAGFFGAGLLALTPCWIGHGLFNPKDIPFGTAAAFTTLATITLAVGPPIPRWRDVLWAAIAAGITLAIRPAGSFVLGYPLLAMGTRSILGIMRTPREQRPRECARSLVRIVAAQLLVVVVAWSIMLSAWPWAVASPITGPLEAMARARHYTWNAEVLFQGEMIRARSLPPTYLPVWFLITLPETFLLAFVAGVCVLVHHARNRSWNAERAIGAVTLASCVFLPLTAMIVTHATVYDAQRHALFLIPPAAALGGWAVSACLNASWSPRELRVLVAASALVLSGAAAWDIVLMHPFEYVYFNRSSGGLRGNYKRFETDYWGVTYREGLAWVLNDMPAPRRGQPILVSSCDYVSNLRLQYYVADWPEAAKRLKVVSRNEYADAFLAIRRWGCADRWKGSTLHIVQRQETPLLYVRHVRKIPEESLGSRKRNKAK